MMSAFDRIIGYALVKRELQQISDTLKTRKAYSRLGSAPSGLLLYGEPGVGKSLMAEALIEESSCRSFLCRKDASRTLFVREQLAAAEVERYYRKAKEILAQNQDFLEKMAPALVDRGFCWHPISRK